MVRTYALLMLYYAATWPSRFPRICPIIAKPHINILFLTFLFTPRFWLSYCILHEYQPLLLLSVVARLLCVCVCVCVCVNFLVVVKYLFYLFICLAVLGLICSMWDLRSSLKRIGSCSLTMDQTQAPCIGSVES